MSRSAKSAAARLPTHRRWFPWAVYGVAIVLLGPFSLAVYTVVPKPGELSNCGGIGFGEQPCGWDAVGLSFILLVVPYMILFAVVLAISELFGPRATRARSIIAIVGLAIPWALAFIAAISSA